MFGLFKKSLAWGELEFLFKTSACTVFKEKSPTSQQLDEYIGLVLESGNYKLTPEQRSVLISACTTVSLSSNLRSAFKDCNLPTGELDAKRFAALQEMLGQNLIWFRDTPTHGSMFSELRSSLQPQFSPEPKLSAVDTNQSNRPSTMPVATRPLFVNATDPSKPWESSHAPESNEVRWDRLKEDTEKADAQYKLGLRYENGDGVEDNCIQAVRWYAKAAEQGHTEAKYRLGMLYKSGLGVNRNLKTALEWIASAENDGFEPAINERKKVTELINDEKRREQDAKNGIGN